MTSTAAWPSARSWAPSSQRLARQGTPSPLGDDAAGAEVGTWGPVGGSGNCTRHKRGGNNGQLSKTVTYFLPLPSLHSFPKPSKPKGLLFPGGHAHPTKGSERGAPPRHEGPGCYFLPQTPRSLVSFSLPAPPPVGMTLGQRTLDLSELPRGDR